MRKWIQKNTVLAALALSLALMSLGAVVDLVVDENGICQRAVNFVNSVRISQGLYLNQAQIWNYSDSSPWIFGEPGVEAATPSTIVKRDINASITAEAFYGDGSHLTGVSSLPSQTGNTGKYLQTDGSAASWQAVASATQAVYNYTDDFTITAAMSCGLITNYGATKDIVGTLNSRVNLGAGFNVQLCNEAGVISANTSYDNTNGTGNRLSTITFSSNMTKGSGTTDLKTALFDGSITGGQWGWAIPNESVVGKYIEFWFAESVIINEIKFYNMYPGGGQGTWQLKGSHDDTNWYNIGEQFVLDSSGTSPQVITAPANNLIAYRYYIMTGVSGNVADGPWVEEMEFKIGTTVNTAKLTITPQISDKLPGAESPGSSLQTSTANASITVIASSNNILIESVYPAATNWVDLMDGE